ncbi:ABC transporter permease [Paracoccus endophyticus]|uniref:ABC transporter permease n=1 Tax=Paracoccus endophyticus TaxID=2233774 RepID=UPI001F0C0A5B|nr:ABC transporter permease [Paracoccus endophyticus]
MTSPDLSAPPQRRGQPARRPRFRMLRTIVALMLREISTTYGRSVGGYAWALLDPILGIALLTVVFQGALGARNPMIGTNFPLFYATGYIPFAMYNDIAGKMAHALRYSRPLLAYPAVTFVDALVARWLLNVVTHLIVFVIVVGGIALFYRLPLVMDVGTVMQALALIGLLAAGLGTMNCFLIMRFPVWERAWSILTRPLFLMSAVFYTFESMPNVAQSILWWNPLVHLIGLLRRGVYGVYPADYVSVLYVVSLSVGLFLFGLLLLWRRYRDLLEQA